MNEKFTITNVQSGTMTAYEDVNSSMILLAKAVNAVESTEKDIAKAFEELRTTPNFKEVFHETKFQVVAETFTEGKYSGSTAYKYAQMYKLFNNMHEVWDNFSIGKMIILSPLVSSKNTKSGITLNGFFGSLGMVIINRSIEFRNAWDTQTASMRDKIEKLRSVGLDDMARDIEMEIPAMPDVEGAEWIENEEGKGEWVAVPEIAVEMGQSIAIKFKDKQLKDAVSDYIRSIKPARGKAEKQDEKISDGLNKEKSVAELKAEALSALMAYTEKLETVPAILNRAINNLNE